MLQNRNSFIESHGTFKAKGNQINFPTFPQAIINIESNNVIKMKIMNYIFIFNKVSETRNQIQDSCELIIPQQTFVQIEYFRKKTGNIGFIFIR